MIDAWEQLKMAITHEPVVISLDAKVLEAMAKMRGHQADGEAPVAHEKADDPELDEAGGADGPTDKPLVGSQYIVIVEHGQVVGLLTEQDFGRMAVQQVPLEQLTLRQILRRPPITIKESDLSDLVSVLTLFQQHHLSHLPVLDNTHQLIGVISASDLYQLLHDKLTANTDTALKASQKQVQHLAENMPGMIYRLVRRFDGDYALTYVSPQVEEMFEVKPKTILQNINHFWERIHPDDLSLLHAELQFSAQSLTPCRIEHRLNLPTKGLRWVKMMAHAEQVTNGDVIWDGVILDICDRKQTRAELQRTSQELDRVTSLSNEFLANMSYALRTPLNTMLGITEGLQDGVFGKINPQQLETLQTIQQSGSHQLELLNEILDLAKAESGNFELAYSAVSVAHLCQGSLAAVDQQSRGKEGIQLHLNMPWNLPDIRVDEHRIRKVLVHLLHHAVKQAPAGGEVTLEVIPSLPDDTQIQHTLRFIVADSNLDQASDDNQLLFQSFNQAEGNLNDPQKGAGLGWELVKRIVELHGGRLMVSSEDGLSQRVALELPYDIPAKDLPPAPVTAKKFNASAPKVKPATEAPLILLAEDNEANIIGPSSYLQAKGYRIQVAKNGQAAIELAQTEMPHVILMDIQMPVMDGLTAIQHIRELPALENTPIIALTAFAMEGDQARCLAAGANTYLSKPVKLKQLAASIEELIAQ